MAIHLIWIINPSEVVTGIAPPVFGLDDESCEWSKKYRAESGHYFAGEVGLSDFDLQAMAGAHLKHLDKMTEDVVNEGSDRLNAARDETAKAFEKLHDDRIKFIEAAKENGVLKEKTEYQRGVDDSDAGRPPVQGTKDYLDGYERGYQSGENRAAQIEEGE